MVLSGLCTILWRAVSVAAPSSIQSLSDLLGCLCRCLMPALASLTSLVSRGSSFDLVRSINHRTGSIEGMNDVVC